MHWPVLSLLAVFLVVTISVLFSHNAFAGREVNSRLSWGNAGAYCGSGSSRGMVWLSNDGSDYYSERVNVSEGDAWVGVQVRGAVNSCSTPPGDDAITQTWAVNVAVDAGSSGILSISGTEFYRGNLDRNVVQGWSHSHEGNPAGYLNGSLNVSGVAPCSAAVNNISTGTLTVGVYRSLQYRQQYPNGSWTTTNGLPGTEYITLTITRSCPLDFTLEPSILLDDTVVEPGDPVTASPTVNNTGTTASSNAQWQVTRFRLNPGVAIPGAAVNGTSPVSYYGNGATTVAQGTRSFPRNLTSLPAVSENIPDLPAGTKICFALSVQPRTQNDSSWNHGLPLCVTIAKKPKVQVLGGDLNVGRSSAYNLAPAGGSQVATSISRSISDNRYYGSWSEYAIIASSNVRNMASGALFVGGSASNDLCSLSLLTLSNRNGSSCQSASVGNFTFTSTAPNVATRFPVTSNIGGNSVDLRTLAHSQTYSVGPATLNVSSSQPFADNGAGKGRWVVINDPGVDVTITSNLNYANNTLSQIDDIPQIVIIARNITIAPNVTNVDAWLIAVGTGANGYVNTCGSVPAGAPTSANLNTGTCNTKLTVNGPVMANKLYMYRTAGSGTGTAIDDPAEVFNLRADAYIWASAYSPGNGRVPTVSTKELPPRF